MVCSVLVCIAFIFVFVVWRRQVDFGCCFVGGCDLVSGWFVVVVGGDDFVAVDLWRWLWVVMCFVRWWWVVMDISSLI